jgi:hypothetical protein
VRGSSTPDYFAYFIRIALRASQVKCIRAVAVPDFWISSAPNELADQVRVFFPNRYCPIERCVAHAVAYVNIRATYEQQIDNVFFVVVDG